MAALPIASHSNIALTFQPYTLFVLFPAFLSSPPPPTPLAKLTLLVIFTVLLSLPSLDSSRHLWLYSPSYLQWKHFPQT